jgi:chromosome segregation ATPase
MSLMDIERTMQFILEQQARHEAAVQKHDEQFAKNAEQIAALTASVQKHDEQIATLTNLVGRLAQAEIRIAERMEGHEARLSSLETKMTQFLDRMDRFIQGQEGNGHKTQ